MDNPIILPATFTGGARFMIQNYQDAMEICRWAGYPDLFITFTCNPKWPEIVRFIQSDNLKLEDKLGGISRIFRTKLKGLIRDLRDNKIFGTIISVIYTAEFQKRGLPHVHILIFLSKEDKCQNASGIDRIISAKIPDEKDDPKYYAAVSEFMIHGPCGHLNPSSPCMVDEKCTKHFPKRFVASTTVDNEGYPVYRRRDNGRTVKKNGKHLDNRWVVPHNRYLLLKYGAHLNVEWCNQSRSIKYLFKYVNKGNDRATAAFYHNKSGDSENGEIDEINTYYDCRYISPCEAAWRIFGYEIQYKKPVVIRLSFHLPGQQNVLMGDNESLQEVIQKPSALHTMFLGWFEANKKYPEARNLTYVEFPQKFVWNSKKIEWTPRKEKFALA